RAHTERYVAKRWIAAEKFVSTKAGNCHLESQFMRGFADEPCVESIDRRLVHRLENFGQIVAKFLLCHETRGMSRAILCRDLARDGGLVLIPAAKFLKRESHRLDILLPGIPH